MRIISGIGKGRTLFSPPLSTRPTSDRAREGLFSTLESAFSSIQDLRFLDLFSGSGAVGVEALSRGASYVVSVEEKEAALNSIKKNFALIESRNTVHIYPMSVTKYFNTIHEAIPFDCIFLDPPYELDNAEIINILQQINSQELLNPSGVIAVERSSRTPPFEWPAGFQSEKQRNYGEAVIYYAGLGEDI
jgi:16S rRNA (guanine966-N2)-methyltransferase